MSRNDVDGDGYDDVVVGDGDARVGGSDAAGRIVVLYGSARGIATGAKVVVSKSSFGAAPHPVENFGRSLAIGDVTGDGCADLLVGTPNEDAGGQSVAGAVYLVSLVGRKVTATRITQAVATGGTPEEYDNFGSAVAVSGAGAGRTVFAVAADRETIGGRADAGEVDVFAYTWRTRTISAVARLANDDGRFDGQPSTQRAFGQALVFDRSRSGRSTLFVGAPGATVGGRLRAGMVMRYDIPGAGAGAVTGQQWTQSSTGVAGVPEQNDRFGSSVALVPPGGGRSGLLAVGVPGEAIGSVAGAGSVQLFGDDGATIRPTVAFDQDTAGVGGAVETGDHFGATLAIRASDHRVAVGATGERLTGRESQGWVQTFDATDTSVTARAAYSANAVAPGRLGSDVGFGSSMADIDGVHEDVVAVGDPGGSGDDAVLVLSDQRNQPTRAWIAGRDGLPESGLISYRGAIAGSPRS